MRSLRRGTVVAFALAAAGLVVVVPTALCVGAAVVAIREGEAAVLGPPVLGSFVLAVLVAALGTTIAVATALAAVAAPRPLRRALDVAMLAPVLVPPAAVAVVVLRLGGRAGWLQPIAPGIDVHGLPGLVLATTVAHVPLAYVILRIGTRSIDARQVDAARVVGASGDLVLRRIVLPRLRGPALLAATTLVVAAVVDPSIPAVLRGRHPTLAAAALAEVAGSGDPRAAALAALAIAALLVAACIPALRRGLGGLGGDAAGGWSGQRLPLAGGLLGAARAVTLVAVAGVVLVAAAFVVSVVDAVRTDGAAIVADALLLATTILHAVAALAIAVALGTSTAWIARTSRPRVAAGIDRAHLLVAFVPATAIGVGTSIAYREGTAVLPPLVGGAAVAGGSIAIVAMLVVACQPLVHAGLRIGASQLPGRVEDAARVVGGTPRRMAGLVLSRTRLLAVAFAAALTARAIVTVVPVVHVSSPTVPLVTTRILDAVDAAAYGTTLATSAATALATGVLMAAVWVALQLRGLGMGERA